MSHGLEGLTLEEQEEIQNVVNSIVKSKTRYQENSAGNITNIIGPNTPVHYVEKAPIMYPNNSLLKGSILFLTGAGASVDSGLRTYRGKDGVYEGQGSPMSDLSIDTWRSNPERVWSTLAPLINSGKKAIPGETYQLMKTIASRYDCSVYTQNVDGLSKSVCDKVWEMHGNVETMTCEKCKITVPLDEENYYCQQIVKKDPINESTKCLNECKPNIVFYGEQIRANTLPGSPGFATVLVIGSTMQFQYLFDILAKWKRRGAKIIHINPDKSYASCVGEGEIWFKMKSAEALKMILGE